MISLSLCMIVKNEEKVLPRILKPMKEIVDKILICDTGSTDRTKEIIREFTAEVYDFPWKNDFSAARNFISEKVSTDYWMWLDADDIVSEPEQKKIQRLKEEHSGKSVQTKTIKRNTESEHRYGYDGLCHRFR